MSRPVNSVVLRCRSIAFERRARLIAHLLNNAFMFSLGALAMAAWCHAEGYF